MSLTKLKFELVKELLIDKVQVTRASNAPYQIIAGDSNVGDEGAVLTLDKETCERRKFPISLDLAGKTLICTFKNRELSPKPKDVNILGLWDMREMKSSDLIIDSIGKLSEISISMTGGVEKENGEIDPKFSKVEYLMKLVSRGRGDGVHPHALPCPYYEFVLELTEDEYHVCKALPASTVFRLGFKIKEED